MWTTRALVAIAVAALFWLAGAPGCSGTPEGAVVQDDDTTTPAGGSGGAQNEDAGGASAPQPNDARVDQPVDAVLRADAGASVDARVPHEAGPRLPPPMRPVGNIVYAPEGNTVPALPQPNPEPIGALVAGYGARRVTSPDGLVFGNDVQSIERGFDDWDNLRASTADGGYYVAVGGGPKNEGGGSFGRGYWRVLVSADGIDWVDMRGVGNWFGGVAYGNGLWVAAGGNGWWGHSKDLVYWVQNPEHPTNNSAYRDLAFGDGMFIAVGGGNRMMSRDGLKWTQRTAGSSQAIVFGGGKFVAVGSDGCAVTSDGITWRERACTGPVRDVTYGNGRFVATDREQLLVSEDTVTWTKVATQVMTRVGFAQGVFVGGTPGGIIKTSVDGKTWKIAYRKAMANDWNTIATAPSGPP